MTTTNSSEWAQDMAVDTDSEGAPLITVVAAGELPTGPATYYWRVCYGFLYLYLLFGDDREVCTVLRAQQVKRLAQLRVTPAEMRVADAKGSQLTVGFPNADQVAEARARWGQ